MSMRTALTSQGGCTPIACEKSSLSFISTLDSTTHPAPPRHLPFAKTRTKVNIGPLQKEDAPPLSPGKPVRFPTESPEEPFAIEEEAFRNIQRRLLLEVSY